MKIWCLFSIENNYDQPSHNLEAWWVEKPTFEKIASVLNTSFPANNNDTTLGICNIWQGQEHRHNNTDYWLEEVEEGIIE
jgi:hypothetical protein